MSIKSSIMRDALRTSAEFRYTAENVSQDEEVENGSDAYNDFWTDKTAYSELLYVESTFREHGHINCDERRRGMHFEHARLKNLIKKYAHTKGQ